MLGYIIRIYFYILYFNYFIISTAKAKKHKCFWITLERERSMGEVKTKNKWL